MDDRISSRLRGILDQITELLQQSQKDELIPEYVVDLAVVASDALAALHRLIQAGAAPPVVLGALAGHFRKLLRARSGGALSGHPFAVRKIESQARRYRPARLESCLRALHEVDEVLKGLVWRSRMLDLRVVHSERETSEGAAVLVTLHTARIQRMRHREYFR